MLKINPVISSFFLLLITCFGCVPINQQVSASEGSEIQGPVSPLVINENQFYHLASSRVYDRMMVGYWFDPSTNKNIYEGTFGGNLVYISNCRCMEDPKIIQNKLIVEHFHGGGSDRENTKLLWNGKYYQNYKGEYIVDLILFSDKIDYRLSGVREKKILDVAAVRRENVSFVWINLVGYDGLIRYDY